MLDTLLSGPFMPFTLSLALLFGLLALELVVLMLGGSLMGDNAEVDGPDLDGDLEFEVEVELEALDLDGLDLDGLDGFDAEALDLEGMDFDTTGIELAPEGASVTAAPSPLGWLGLGMMPTLIWLACLFMAFGVAGVALQAIAIAALGGPFPALLAAIPSALAAVWFTGRFGALFARLIPKTESQSVSSRQLGRRKGTVTQGTARRGTPAEVRVTDRYGNTHYLRAEPLKDADTIPQGTEVLVLRHRPSGGFRLIAL
ncbi:YqiJ family protein [Rhodobacteraceae bacterium N5(2021)]|uniref:YqiJ family protein n=1 Tax=Gymnodinialimonas phycosphaerae TaxID=2841589 RepID=A0A975TVW0_9RHOB|nr:YqiJ family protein [Gymnodinialimonas phycosphaerae]MBY4891591.1 YqiJ family protein [Gymnodinialimonas phycosphaerae]